MIYIKTERGQSALLDRSVGLAPRQRSAFILFDGRRSDGEVLKATTGLGVTPADIDQLVTLGLLSPVLPSSGHAPDGPTGGAGPSGLARAPVEPGPAATPAATASPSLDTQAHFLKAWPIATRLTAGLGLRGFRLNLAVEAAGDLAKLKELAPRIKEAVGAEKFHELEVALYL